MRNFACRPLHKGEIKCSSILTPNDVLYNKYFTKCRYISMGEECQYICKNEEVM